MIDYKSLNLFLLFVLAVLLFLLYSLNNKRSMEGFEDGMSSSMEPNFLNNDYDSTSVSPIETSNTSADGNLEVNSNATSLEAMFENLEKAEIFCDNMERREKSRENETRANIHRMAKDQLESQKKRIDELKSVLEFLKQEKSKRETISEKCRANTQNNLNKDIKLVKKLTEAGMIPNEKTKVEIKISDDLQKIVNSIKKTGSSVEGFTNPLPAPRFTSDQCPHIDQKKFIHVSDLRKCVGCDASDLVRNINYINRDFA